jgi:hypothetical protein
MVSFLRSGSFPWMTSITKSEIQATSDEKKSKSSGSRYRSEILNADPIVDQQEIAARANK